MNRMIARTMSPGGTTAAWRLIVSGKAWPHHAATGGDAYEHERAQDLGEQSPPLLAGVVEVPHAGEDTLLVPGDRPEDLGLLRARRSCVIVIRVIDVCRCHQMPYSAGMTPSVIASTGHAWSCWV
jgi:hypothetical protein